MSWSKRSDESIGLADGTKHAAGSVLFACVLAVGGFITVAWVITLLWGALSLVSWLVG